VIGKEGKESEKGGTGGREEEIKQKTSRREEAQRIIERGNWGESLNSKWACKFGKKFKETEMMGRLGRRGGGKKKRKGGPRGTRGGRVFGRLSQGRYHDEEKQTPL